MDLPLSPHSHNQEPESPITEPCKAKSETSHHKCSLVTLRIASLSPISLPETESTEVKPHCSTSALKPVSECLFKTAAY